MSKTVIDTLVVALGLELKDFEAGGKDVAQITEAIKKKLSGVGEAIDAVGEKQDKNNKNTQASNKKTGESFGSVTNSIYKLTAAFLGVSAVVDAWSEDGLSCTIR